MSNLPTAPAITATQLAGTQWTEEKLADSLEKLDELHKRLIALRNVIPKILYPLNTDYPTPTDMFVDLSDRAHSCSEDIKAFTTLYTSYKWIFDQAETSRRANPDGISRVSTTEMFAGGGPEVQEEGNIPDVPEAAANQSDQVKNAELGRGDYGLESTRGGEVRGILGEFRKMYPEVEVDAEEMGRGRLKVTLPHPAGLVFTVSILAQTDTDTAEFLVTDVRDSHNVDSPPMNMHIGIFRVMNSRDKPGDLKMLLDSIAQYFTIYSAKCEACGKLCTGAKAEFPVVRKHVGNGNWVALHESCL